MTSKKKTISKIKNENVLLNQDNLNYEENLKYRTKKIIPHAPCNPFNSIADSFSIIKLGRDRVK